MAIYLGNTAIKKVYLGATEIKKIYKGSTLLYSSFTYDPDLLTYIDGLVTPLSTEQLILLNNTIVNLKVGLGIANLSQAFDAMYILAGETQESALRNLVKRLHDATAVNTPSFVPFEGFTSNLTSSYINSNYNPSTQGQNFIQDSASWGIYSRTSRAGSNSKVIIGNTSLYQRMLLFNISNQVTGGVNSVGYDPVANANSLGFFIYQRPDNTRCQLSKNGSTFADGLGESTAPANTNTYILCTNNAGTPLTYDDCQCSIAFMGRSFSNAEALVIYNAFQAYMTANGKQV